MTAWLRTASHECSLEQTGTCESMRQLLDSEVSATGVVEGTWLLLWTMKNDDDDGDDDDDGNQSLSVGFTSCRQKERTAKFPPCQGMEPKSWAWATDSDRDR
eukprot:2790663-Amphidinium_carterae.1